MRHLIVGVDAASPTLIRRWKDSLPNLRSIMGNGVSGTLESVVPPSSVPAWQCFATGKNPAKLGVYGFAYIGRDWRLKHGTTTPDLGCFWDICSNKGMKVGVLNVPGTYPPYPVNGFMISGFPVPPRSVWAYPKGLMKKLDSALGGYQIDSPHTNPTELKGGEDEFLRQVEELRASRLDAARLLVGWYQPDVLFLTLQEIDVVQHDFWQYVDTDSPHKDALLDQYRKTDETIGELMKLASSDTNVVILSDHGSTRTSASLYINKFLESHGFLVLRNRGSVKRKGKIHDRFRKFLMKTLPPGFIATLYSNAPKFVSRGFTDSAKIERTLVEIIDSVDWERSTAFSTGGHEAAIYLTHVGAGDGTSKEAATISNICDMISQLEHPVTGEKLQPIFHLREDTFHGPYLDEAPELCVEIFSGDQKIQVNPKLGAKEMWSTKPHFSAIHTREGYWAMSGPRVRHGVSLNASLLDLAPTILRMLDLDPPSGLDGRVLTEAFL